MEVVSTDVLSFVATVSHAAKSNVSFSVGLADAKTDRAEV